MEKEGKFRRGVKEEYRGKGVCYQARIVQVFRHKLGHWFVFMPADPIPRKSTLLLMKRKLTLTETRQNPI